MHITVLWLPLIIHWYILNVVSSSSLLLHFLWLNFIWLFSMTFPCDFVSWLCFMTFLHDFFPVTLFPMTFSMTFPCDFISYDFFLWLISYSCLFDTHVKQNYKTICIKIAGIAYVLLTTTYNTKVEKTSMYEIWLNQLTISWWWTTGTYTVS